MPVSSTTPEAIARIYVCGKGRSRPFEGEGGWLLTDVERVSEDVG